MISIDTLVRSHLNSQNFPLIARSVPRVPCFATRISVGIKVNPFLYHQLCYVASFMGMEQCRWHRGKFHGMVQCNWHQDWLHGHGGSAASKYAMLRRALYLGFDALWLLT